MAESITVVWSWHAIGSVALVESKLTFPGAPGVAGVYRFTATDASDRLAWAYVGEAEVLRRRFQQYRTPGSSQQTNVRLNRIMTDTLAHGGQINVEIVREARAAGEDGEPIPLDLDWKAARALVERAAEVVARRGDVPVLNL